MRVIVTGAGGFAGGHLVHACAEAGDEVVRVSRSSGDLLADLTDRDAARRVVADTRPDVIYHLAAQAHVGRSWQDPAGTLHGNLDMTLNLLEAVREEVPDTVFLLASSGEIYGPPRTLPVDEEAPLRPHNPYAVSKVACDLLCGVYANAHGLRAIRARAFNHAGPGQEPAYAIASFARQAAAGLEAGDDPVRIITGNPHTRRDYTDVRDVVRAYRDLAARGEPGVFNICSGRPASASDLLTAIAVATRANIDHQVDQSLVRANEVMEIRGSFYRLHTATGWEPEISLEQTVADTVEWWREEIRAGRATEQVTE